MTVLLVAYIAAAMVQAGPIRATPGAPPQPAVIGEIVITSTSGFTCALRGNGYPATALLYGCTVGGTTFGPNPIPAPANAGFSLTYNYLAEAIGFVVRSDAAGKIQVEGGMMNGDVTMAHQDWVVF